jgi:HPt (histidine-containing phosphotransfer) domain-containing protein
MPSPIAPPIDVLPLIERCMGDRDFVREMLSLFRQQMTQHLAKLSDCIAAGDVEGVRKVAHAMKGSAANLSANALSALCATAEHRAKTGTLPPASALDAIRIEFDRVIAYYPTVESRLS